MKRLKKAMLIPLRSLSYRWNRLGLYYWAEARLFELRAVNIMPALYYRWLFRFSMRLVEFGKFRRLANWVIHTIPFHMRYTVA
jgi:hypothetical protein